MNFELCRSHCPLKMTADSVWTEHKQKFQIGATSFGKSTPTMHCFLTTLHGVFEVFVPNILLGNLGHQTPPLRHLCGKTFISSYPCASPRACVVFVTQFAAGADFQ